MNNYYDYDFNNYNYSNNNVNNNIDPYKGFIRGNIFDSLYDPYKNYKPLFTGTLNAEEALDTIEYVGNDLKSYNSSSGVKSTLKNLCCFTTSACPSPSSCSSPGAFPRSWE